MRFFAEVKWTPGDIQTLKPDWSDEQAKEWLEKNARAIRDRLVELGWEVIEDLLR